MENLPEDTIVAGAIETTRRWVEKAVVGLNLCPFAKAPFTKGQIRYAVSAARDPEALLADLIEELHLLAAADPEQIETTLLIHPGALQDFLDYNDFLDVADAALTELNLDGILQVASFHPRYQFAGTQPDDLGNYSNRSPYPCLHLLREASVDKAVEAFPEADKIYLQNIETLERLGREGWAALEVDAPALIRPAGPPTDPD
jgi:uncharacterized protein